MISRFPLRFLLPAGMALVLMVLLALFNLDAYHRAHDNMMREAQDDALRQTEAQGAHGGQGVEVGEIGRFGSGAGDGRLDGDRQTLLLFKGLGDRVSGRQGDVDDRLTALDGVLDRVQGPHVRAHIGCDREDGAVVLGRRDLQSGVDAVLNRTQLTVGAREVLQGDHRAHVRVNAVQRHGT